MVWSKHGESPDQPIERDNSNSSNSDHDRMHEMLNDFGRQFDVGPEADARTMPKEVEEFYKLLAAAEEVLHESTKVTVLEAVTRLMSGKAKFNFSNECYNFITLSQKLGGDVPEFRPPPQVFPQVPPNLFNAPINQGPPLGAPQGWVGPNAPEFRAPQFSPQVGPNYFVTTPTSQGSTGGEAQGSQPCNQLVQFGRGSQPQQWTYPTQGPTFGDASQPPPQWMYPGNPMMMYGGQQPMFYPGSQPPYYMPWRPTPPPMTPPVVAVRTQTSPKMKPRRDPPPGAI
ncbi:hypothetical protein U9M48_027386 [Paspalum notatum var. saurae]|uniref:Uncharacterized protein n=1 Tax=Paspalum notatum var. saurae TaxID=547442 RepID=A0AAQ3WZI6_PASNO